MDPIQQLKFGRKLKELEVELEEALELNSESTDVVKLDTNIGRLSRMDQIQNQAIAKELKERQQLQLQRVVNSLKKVAKGNYGTCPTCKKPIAEARLEAQPEAVQCVSCAEKI
ncbi:TraR/DksA C4-type zinc finger protein [Verrucomicrobia bacterium]|nr:TraR/DksA C4-type zinc finger protein [Verrucomicrobiota bacterium]